MRNLLGQSIRTSMQNLESVAQKMAELWVFYFYQFGKIGVVVVVVAAAAGMLIT